MDTPSAWSNAPTFASSPALSVSSLTENDLISGAVKTLSSPRSPKMFSGPPSPRTFGPTHNDKAVAVRLMMQEQLKQGKTHSKPFSSFSSKESRPLLADIVSGRLDRQQGVTPGVVEVLLSDYDASLSAVKPRSSSLSKNAASIGQDDLFQSTDLLSQAVQNCDAEILATLLQHADLPSKSKALAVAMRTDDPVKVQFVMAAGANAAPLCEEFQEVVQLGSFEMLHAVVAMSRTRKPCQSCLNVALLHAVNQGCLRRTRSLIHNGADLTSNCSGALLSAVLNGRADLVAVLTTEGPDWMPKASPEILDYVVELAYQRIDGGQGVDANYHHVLELCLAAGACGKGTSRTLANAIRQHQFDILDMFVRQYVPAFKDEDAGMAIVHAAIATERPEIVKTILSVRDGPNRTQEMDGTTQTLKLQNHRSGLATAGLLLQRGLHGNVAVSKVLVSTIRLLCACSAHVPIAVEAYPYYYEFVKLFVDRSTANVDHNGGEPILLAAGSGLIDVLGLLIKRHPTVASLSKAVTRAMGLQDPQTRHATIKMLLEAGANGPPVGEALILAASNSTEWPSAGDDALELVTELLKSDAGSEYASDALLSIVEGDCASEDVIEALITVGESHANVNFRDGEVLKLAIGRGKPDLLDHILNCACQTGPVASQGTMTQAFAEAITTDRLEYDDTILEVLDVLMKPRIGAHLPDTRALGSKWGNWAPIFSCIATHPDSPRLVKRLAEFGCDMEPEMYMHLYMDEEVEAEPANPLLWAISWPRVSSTTIESLLETGAKVNCTSEITGATPLILAAKYDRGDVVAMLVAKGARVSVKDQFDRSALFYASRAGNLDAIKALIKAKSRVNDGSLQEAARNLHSDAVQLLMDAGHSTNYPSGDKSHDGRDALQELALMARPKASQVSQLEDTIKALVSSRDQKDKIELLRGSNTSGHKNASFLALDNQGDGCLLVCRALLEVVMWKVVDKKANTYCVLDPETGTKLYMSPTTYIRVGLSHGQEKHKNDLLRLLYRMRCQDRLYAEYGCEQPPEAVGMPDDIAKAALKRKELEKVLKLIQEVEDHQRAVIRKKHEAQVQRQMERLHHEGKQEQKLVQQEKTQNIGPVRSEGVARLACQRYRGSR